MKNVAVLLHQKIEAGVVVPSPARPALARVASFGAQVGQARLASGEGMTVAQRVVIV